jgi:hypothetical protein
MVDNIHRSDDGEHVEKPMRQTDRILASCGYLLVVSSVLCFGSIGGIKIYQAIFRPNIVRYENLLGFLQQESPTLVLLLIGWITATMGRSLLTTVKFSDTRTIPLEDLPLIEDAVIKGNAEPIDQYLRLRSLTGIAGNFTKLQVTGLPLTTVFLTLVFSAIALIPLADEKLPGQFLDLAKLTLGAFIGSFVQGRVEQRKQQQALPASKTSESLPPV